MQATQRYVMLAYLVLGLVTWVTVAKLLAGLAFMGSIPDPSIVGALNVSGLLGLFAGAGLTAYLARSARVNAYSADVATELDKVAWPTRKDTQSATVVVIVTTIVLAVLLGLIDLVWAKLTGLIYA